MPLKHLCLLHIGNKWPVAKLMTSKFPLVVVLAELAAQLRRLHLVLELGWVPRDQNEEADALSNEVFDAFDPRLRVDLDLTRVSWIILPRLMQTAESLYQEIKSRKEAKGTSTSRARRPAHLRLRQREPW